MKEITRISMRTYYKNQEITWNDITYEDLNYNIDSLKSNNFTESSRERGTSIIKEYLKDELKIKFIIHYGGEKL